MTKALIIPLDQECRVEELDGLAAFQAVVGGSVQCITLEDGNDMWFNEDGKGLGLEFNVLATILAGPVLFPGDFIAGPAFLTGHVGSDGESTDIDDETAAVFCCEIPAP